MMFPLKLPFREDFPASHAWLPESTRRSRTSCLKCRSIHVCRLFENRKYADICSWTSPWYVERMGQGSLFHLSENDLIFQNGSENEAKTLQNHHFEANLMMINWLTPGFVAKTPPSSPSKMTKGQGSTLAGRRAASSRPCWCHAGNL